MKSAKHWWRWVPQMVTGSRRSRDTKQVLACFLPKAKEPGDREQKDLGSIPELGQSPGEGNGHLLGASVRNSAHGKGHKEGSLAYAKA